MMRGEVEAGAKFPPMGALQRNAGTAGIAAAIFLAILFLLFVSSGLTPEIMADASKALPMIADQGTRAWLTGGSGALGVAFSLVFVAGLYRRLRDGAPTRAAAVLILSIVGLAGFGLASYIWMGAAYLATEVKDSVAASHAWYALMAVNRAADALGWSFTGAASILAGWAIMETRALSKIAGWIAVISGAFSLLAFLAPTSIPAFFGAFVLTIVWLGWAGNEMRRAPR